MQRLEEEICKVLRRHSGCRCSSRPHYFCEAVRELLEIVEKVSYKEHEE